MTELARLQKYVEWNRVDRHQLIVAHMTLVREAEGMQEKLRQLQDILLRHVHGPEPKDAEVTINHMRKVFFPAWQEG